jgi:hypothetical protein
VLAFTLEVRPDQRVSFRGLAGYPFPETCVTYAWSRLKCPGCGLTRSMISLARGNLAHALELHRLCVPMAALVLIQIPYRLLCIAEAGKSPLSPRLLRWIGYLVILALLGNWIFDIVSATS